jgi:VanZ family protein
MMLESPNPSGRGTKGRTLWLLLLVGYWLVLFAATHVPSDFPAVPSAQWDKVAHFVAYALLGAGFAMAWQLASGRLTLRQLLTTWIVVVVYGALDEWTQSFVGRDTSFFDWMADAAGAAAGLTMFARLRWQREPHQ